ncbi:Rtr1/RPAP2 family-domain-containing protein [Hypoxylon sp. NC0597]|nr:Rtr1/RPAP2 family-domain-containing protein [Hypoxylon sp. NC0597]
MSSPAASQPKKPKGILKKPTTTTTGPAAPISPFPIEEHKPASGKPTARDVAIQQALLIHQQRQLEDQIQDSIIELARLPLAPSSSPSPGQPQPYDASNPSPTDADSFRSLVRLFQPGDYEDLIEERNTLGKCGYTLCPNPHIKLGKGGAYKLVGYGTRNFNIVPRKELERWCSTQCARRAMYVKVQLSETAAAERAGIPSIRIDLLDEPKQGDHNSKDDSSNDNNNNDEEAAKRVARELRSLEADKEKKAARDAGLLALERGDARERPSTKQVTLTIREKSVTTAAREPSLDDDGDGENHLMLDGYKTTFDPKAHNEQD